jgi:hypothetical protein
MGRGRERFLIMTLHRLGHPEFTLAFAVPRFLFNAISALWVSCCTACPGLVMGVCCLGPF